MKRILLLSFFFYLFSSSLLADEFIIKSFKQIKNKVLTHKDKVTDANDDLCAIILIRTSLLDLGINSSGGGIVGDVKWLEGDYKVHLSAKTRMIKFFKTGFKTEEYVFEQTIEGGKFYLLELEYRRTDAVATGNTLGFVVINSEPAGAEVFINGDPIGLQTPFQNTYNEGYYKFTLKKDFYDDFSGNFKIMPNKTTNKDIKLIANYGSLNLLFNPSTDISVNIDGKISTQNSPYFIDKLNPGQHTIVLNKATYDEYSETFTISKDQTTRLNIEMLANFGGINIVTIPEINAALSIDGVEYGNTPFKLDKLSPGKHSIKLSKSMYLTHEQEIIIDKGKSNTFDIVLKPNFGTLTINAKEDEEIYLDNQRVGSATYTGRLLKGMHIIEVKKENYYPQSRQIEIQAGATLNETFELLPKTGTLQVMTTPIGADVYINDELKGQSPLFVNDLIIGSYSLKLQKQGFATFEKQIEITENQTIILNENLSSATQVQITSNPSGAKLYVDGQYIGNTPQTVSLSFENHRFKLEKEEYDNLMINKTITTTTNSFNFKLEKEFDIEMVLVKGGTFKMGSNKQEDEKPIHKVTLNDFYIGKYEVTQKQWSDVMDNNPSRFTGCDNCPVENVSWNDVQEFIKRLNQQSGQNYRLPTEAEWEYAARGGGQSRGYKYSGSNNIDEVAWYSSNSGNKTHAVGTKSANELGIHDMSGNVWEWCSDWYGSKYYKNSPSNNPKGPSSGTMRGRRGGGWGSFAQFCRASYRSRNNPGYSYGNLGFRLARSVP